MQRFFPCENIQSIKNITYTAFCVVDEIFRKKKERKLGEIQHVYTTLQSMHNSGAPIMAIERHGAHEQQ